MLRPHLRQRKPRLSDIESLHIERSLHGDRIHLHEECRDQVTGGKLDLSRATFARTEITPTPPSEQSGTT